VPPKRPTVRCYERPPGSGRWSVRWREGGRQREERGYESADAAEDRADEIRKRIRQGLPGVREPLTVRELIAQWWDGYVAHRSEATQANYRTSARRVLATLGSENAASLTTPRLIAWADELDGELRNPRLVNECLKVLSGAMQRGVEWGSVESNPVRAVPKRKEPPRSVVIPTREEVARLAIKAPSMLARVRLATASFGGLRPGEQLALEWRHVRGDSLRVEQAVNLRGRVGPTKTGKARDVPIPPGVAGLLEEWRRETRYSALGKPVFPSARGTRYSATPWRRDVWNPWRVDAGVEHLQWRTLRHYYASELAAAGATILQASRWMGHGSIRTTMDRYASLFDEDAARVMTRLG
jgi:integrase